MIKATLLDAIGDVTILCSGCKIEKSSSDYPIRNDRSGRLRPYCKVCSNTIGRARYRKYKETSPFKNRCTKTRARAKSKGLDFNLTTEYLESIWTGRCAAFGIPIKIDASRRDENAAELDRIVPSKGYVIGNVAWLSRKANRIKNNVSSSELKQLWEWLERVSN